MLSGEALIRTLQARVDEITATMAAPDMQELVRLLQSTRARALMDVIDCIRALPETTTEPKPAAVGSSWEGSVDR